MTAIISDEIGSKFAKILGLPDSTIWFEIRFAIGETVKVKGQFHADRDKVMEFLSEFSQYKINNLKICG